MTKANLGRRSFLKKSLAFLLTIFVLSGISIFFKKSGKLFTHNQNNAMPPATPGTFKLGKAYIKTNPSESKLSHLQTQLESGYQPLSKQIEYDYKRGDTLHLNGWLLSRTEYRLCALTYLRHHTHRGIT